MAAVLTFGIAAKGVNADDSSAVVAEVNGHQYTRADLEQLQGSDLLQAKYKYYQVEQKAVEKLVREKLLEDAAKKEGVSPQDLLKKHVDPQVKQPSEAEIRFFYDVAQTDKSLAEVHDQIRDQIIAARREKVAQAYLDTLRKQGHVRVELEPPTTAIASSTAGAPVLGPANAPIKIIEYADYQCPYCKQMYPVIKKLQKDFPNTQLVYEDYPLPMHGNAQKAAEAAHCAGDQGKYWEYHDAIFEHNGPIDVPNLKDIAKGMKLDQAKFDQCLDSGADAAVVAKGKDQGKQLGLTGTPTIFINGHMITGATSYDTLKDVVVQETHANSNSQARAD